MTALTNRPGTAVLVNDMQRDVVKQGHDVDNVTANINSLVAKRYGEQITTESSIESATTWKDHRSPDCGAAAAPSGISITKSEAIGHLHRSGNSLRARKSDCFIYTPSRVALWAMRWRRPVGLEQLDANAAVELARLGGLEGLSRSVMVGVVPLAALEALGSKAAVSYAFIGGQMITLMITINVGWLERKMPRRWVVTLASSFLAVAAGLFLVADGPLFVLAVGLRSAEASIFAVCMSLYIMDYIGKRDLTSTESRRMVYIGASWVIGPTLGVWLWSNAHTSAPFLISIVMTLVTAWYFWRLRLHKNPVLLTPTTAIPNAVHSMVRFFRQRNLRIAYAITTSRAIFWAALFVYGPIYVVESGLPKWAAGVFLSAASGMLFISPMVRITADRLGTRTVIIGALGVMSASMVALAIIGDARQIGLVFWLTGAMGGAAVDMLGNIPFMRLVKPRERIAMTAIFTTWRETSFLLAPVIGAIALGLGSFWLLYLVIAVLLASAAIATSFLPRRL